ncbi:hypothetical protein HQ38_01005 [Porphyromonas crevioricanis]|uniref:Uncharacterized protein n=1 Tax=Porphyromonas crevioricanis TaxID=393921 RepID=A0AB34PHI3_9PORP|nr:hypothetical protein HQ38_01005 [Porphyromonas crevioricanis]
MNWRTLGDEKIKKTSGAGFQFGRQPHFLFVYKERGRYLEGDEDHWKDLQKLPRNSFAEVCREQ